MKEELRNTCWVLGARQWKNFPAVPIEGFNQSRLRAEEGEQDQLFGVATERRGPCNGVARENNICEEEFMAIDPVCGMKVDENRAEFQTQFAGKKYFFCSEDCQSEFENRPDEFATVTAA
jgi:YHS domain-containing protein